MKEIETGASQGLAQGLTISEWKISFLPNATLCCRPKQPGGTIAAFISELLCLGGQGVDGEEARGVG